MNATRQTILVAAGEPLACELMSGALGEAYQLLVVRDGIEAVVRYESNAAQVCAVITEMALPRLGGDLLAEWLHHIDPRLPVIIIMDGADGAEASPSGAAVQLVARPFGGERLRAMLEATI